MVAGLALCLDASNLATHWQAIGENAWGGHESGVGCRVSGVGS